MVNYLNKNILKLREPLYVNIVVLCFIITLHFRQNMIKYIMY